jgi:flagellar P-ring protein precursor FlgI
MVERDTAVDLHDFKTVSLLLRNPDFTTAKSIADAVNAEFHKVVASALDSTRVDVNVADAASPSVPLLISRVQNLALMVYTPAKIVINERTGTIVLGGDVKITPVSVIHGNLSIEVTTSYTVAPIPGAGPGFTDRTREVGGGGGGRPDQAGNGGPAQNQDPNQNPNGGPNGGGGYDRTVQSTPTAALVPQTTVSVNDAPAQTMRLDEGANVEELVNGLHAIGTTAHDVVAILQAIKAEGGIQAEVEVQ